MINPALKIASWNANSITNKKTELILFLEKHNIDILAASETFLKSNMNFSIPNYVTHRLDRSVGQKGGVALFIKANIKHTLMKNFKLKVIEAIGITVPTDKGPVSIVSAYHPAANKDMSAFSVDMGRLTRLGNSYFVCGDFNARHRLWNCASNNAAGNVLFGKLQSGLFSIHHPDTPTYYPSDPNRAPSTLDLVISNNQNDITDIWSKSELSSDHVPFLFEIQNAQPTINPNKFYFNYKMANWDTYRNSINKNIDLSINHLNEINNKDEIDKMISSLSDNISMAHDAAVPKATPGKYNINIPEDIKMLIKLRDKFRKKWQRSRRNREYKSTLLNLNNWIKLNVNETRNKVWTKNLEQINNDDHSKDKIWKLVKVLKNKHSFMPPLTVNNVSLVSAAEKCEAIREQFIRAHYITFDSVSPAERAVNNVTSKFFDKNHSTVTNPELLCTPSEIKQILRKLKNKKSTGTDRINNTMLKRLPNKAIIKLNQIFNGCLKIGYFPDKWKTAKIVSIKKQGKDPALPGSYRPISLLSNLGKIFEKVIASRIRAFTNSNNIIQEEQFGFQSHMSTTHQLQRLVDKLRKERSKKRSTGLVLLDNEKAFDSIWHQGLIYKLITRNIPAPLIKVLKSFLTDRQNIVQINNVQAAPYNPVAGVPQGSVLSPLLFNIFISDIPRLKNCDQYLYADDVALSVTAKQPRKIISSLNSALNHVIK
uniref:Putative reverse transcriptase n=1 Tax=Anopheles darlingi TaxID=43151 RepID=A0A2M4CXW8_ANODA